MTNSNNAQNDRHRARGFRFFLAAALGLTNLAAGPAGFAAEFVPLGFFEGGEPNSFADDVSDDGAVVVGRASRNGGEPEAFRWTATTGLVALGVLPGSFPRSDAHVSQRTAMHADMPSTWILCASLVARKGASRT